MSAITSPARAASQAAVAAPAPIRASLSAPPLVIHDAPDPVAVDLARPEAIAATILAGFDRHYALFRYNAQQAKSRYEAGDWHAIRRLARSRITFYDQRVREGVARLQAQYTEGDLAESAWATVKREYVQLLASYPAPELAETFFNTVSTKILHRSYFHNDFIFVRPAVATEYLDSTPPCYRSYYPLAHGWRRTMRQIIIEMGLACGYQDIERDMQYVLDAARRHLGPQFAPATDCQIHVLRSLFFRNKAAYLIGRLVSDGEVLPFAVPILHDSRGRLFLDAILFGAERIETLFNFSRAYFMVDMEVPSAYVRFLQTLMPTKPPSELYTMLGLHKQGKTLFYRDLLQHLAHSTDRFVVAPGIKGLVMGVFTLPSFPYVFKFIMDDRRKDVTREYIEGRYQLVKVHDRVGRMVDSWEYSEVPFPKDRLDPALIEELNKTAPSLIDDDGDALIIRHLYIERRMVPLNIHLDATDDVGRDHAIKEYGQAIKEMVAANIFPGDMLYKNFGITRQGRVVFYDYDEILYLTDCNFRRVPEPRTPEDEMAAEPWYPIAANDVFPEEFGTFLLGNPHVREPFIRHHADLLEPTFWQTQQERIRQGLLEDVFPYPEALRFRSIVGVMK
ncbi:MAG: bifunctional isocitrate dehydrogenase kinase/phosphatase [Burkholderiaceae bacterium]